MVFLENLPRNVVFCHESPDAALDNGYAHADPGKTSAQRGSLSKKPSRLFSLVKNGGNTVNSALAFMRDGLTEEEREAQRQKQERHQILLLRLKNAASLSQWRITAKELDVVEGAEAWKAESVSPGFDSALIEAELRRLDDARINCDISGMLYLVRTALDRNLGGMDNIRLYMHSRIGTKNLVDRYIDSTMETIQALVEMSRHTLPDGLETKDILEQVVYARQAFGRSALLLSGGATFGMNHVGVLKALYEAKLLPRIISGASAGSIVCAVLCTRTDEEVPQVLKDFPYGDLAVFEKDDEVDRVLDRVRRLLTQGAWIDISHLTRVMQNILGDITFQEAYNRTRRILNICVSSASVYELPRLLNYVTAPNVMIWSAVAASCSVPILFSAAQLLVKNPLTGENTPWNPTPQRWIDGSVDNDLPMTRLAEMFNVNHFIVSQVNPHVVPFLAKDEQILAQDARDDRNYGPGWIYTLTNLAKDEALHRMHVLAELGIFPNLVTKCRSVLSQKYSGDITILPEIDYKDFSRILKNPTPDFMVQACLCGEQATWPKLSRIRNHCAVELELDAAVQKLRARVVFSPSQMDLRRMTTGSFSRSLRKTSDAETVSTKKSSPTMDEDVQDEKEIQLHRSAGSRPSMRSRHSYTNHSRRNIASPTSTRSSPSTPRLFSTFPHRSKMSTTDPLPLSNSPQSQMSYPTSKAKATTQPIKPNLRTLHIPDLPSSAGETTQSPSSDADISVSPESVTVTEGSSPELEAEEGVMVSANASKGNEDEEETKERRQIDLFSRSQPITSGSDYLVAVSPGSTRKKGESRSSLARD